MKCINKSHPDYKALLENSGLKPAILNAKIMVYQEDNNTDEFPKIDSGLFFNDETTQRRITAYDNSLDTSIKKNKIPKYSFHIGDKKVSDSQTELAKLAKSSNETVRRIAQKLLRTKRNVKVNFVKVNKNDANQYNGLYNANVNEIYINTEAIGDRNNYDAVMLEEILHAETVYYLNSNTAIAERWDKIYKYVHKNIPDYWKNYSAFKNKEEFLVAVLKDSKLQDKLKTMPSVNPNPYRNAWSDILDFFARLLGFSSQERNLFTDVFDAAAEVTEEALDSNVTGTSTGFFKNEDITDEEIEDVELDETDSNEELMNTIYNSILDRSKLIEKRDDTYFVNGKEVAKRVTKIVSDRTKNKYKFPDRSKEEKEIDSIKAESGSMVHDFIEIAIKRKFDDDVAKPKFRNKTQEKIYASVEVFVNNFFKEFEGLKYKVLTEVRVYDEKNNVAGTMDLVIVDEFGRVHIFDWKSVNFKYDFKTGKVYGDSVPFYKEFYYQEQLGLYRKILKEAYNIEKFGQIRAFPIRTIFDRRKIDEDKGWTTANTVETLKSLQFVDFQDGDKYRYLRPVISTYERTDNPKLNRLLDILIKRKDTIESEKISGTAEQVAIAIERKQKRLDEVKEAILNIQFYGSVEKFLDNIENEITNAEKIGLDKLSNLEIEELEQHIDFYTRELITLLDGLFDDEVEAKKINAEINRVIAKSVKLKEAIVQDRKLRVIKIGETTGVDNINDVQTETGWWAKNMRSFSQQSHPKLRALYQLVMGSKDKTEAKHNELNDEIKRKTDALLKWGSANGLSGVKVYDKLLKTTDNGRLTLISKYKKDYYDKIKDARLRSDVNWLKKNTVFNKESFDEFLKNRITVWERIYKGDKDAEAKIDKKIAEFTALYGKDSYLNDNSKFFRPTEAWLSEEYKYIQANQPLKDFYELFINKTEEFQGYLGMDKKAGFVWAVQKDFIDSIFDSGVNGFKGLKSVLAQLESNPHQSVGMINEETGLIELSIPKYFINPKEVDGKVDSTNQSRDLGRILSLAGAMAFNYKHMSDIKESADILKASLAPSENQVILTDGNGNNIKDKVTGELKKAFGSSTTLEQFNDYMNYYLYGKKIKYDKDITFNVAGVKISGFKVFNWVSKWYVGKALSGNPVSIMANLFGGNVNAAFIGAKSRYYDGGDYATAVAKLLPGNDKKAYSLIGYFDIIGQNESWIKANDLSVSSLTKNFSYDKLFLGQRGGDWQIRNSILIAMLKSHTIRNDKIVKRNGAEKSLYEMMEFEKKDGKEMLKELNIDEFELRKFRRKVSAVGERVLGNSSRDDIRLLNLTVLGKSMMMFRNWIPTLVDERFGGLRENQDLGDYELGRYRNFWKEINDKKYVPVVRQVVGSLKILRAYGLFGYGGKLTESSKEVAKKMYQEYLSQNENLKMTEEEFIEMHYQNLRANALEMWVLSAMGLILFALSGDDDDKNKSSLRRYLLKQMDRNLNELSFFYSKDSFDAIIKSPIPILGAVQDLSRIVGAVFHHGQEIITGDEKYAKGNELGRSLMRVSPTLNALESFLTIVDDTHGKDEKK